ncbi:MAG: hypothetical protein SVR08_04920, partial [Spirochaetota bacterium]|nr:hypothetical protein [Spirochaetota bacterium]
SRFDAHSKPETSATILSLESQAKSLFTVLAAPLIGFMIDLTNRNSQQENFYPIAVLGILVSVIIIITGFNKKIQSVKVK